MDFGRCNATIASLKYPNGTSQMESLSSGHLCAFDPTLYGRDVCSVNKLSVNGKYNLDWLNHFLIDFQGDSGGPLQIHEGDSDEADSIATVVGIVSFSVTCGSTFPSVYTRIASYREWIESVVWPFY